jgi:hypothetical protein
MAELETLNRPGRVLGAIAATLLLLSGCGGSSGATTAPLGQTSTVGPAGASPGVVRNVQATTDAEGHAEPSIAVDPRDPRDLLGAAQYLTAGGARLPGTFVSTDSGRAWHDNGPLPLPAGYTSGVDTTTAFLSEGVGYVCAFAALPKGASGYHRLGTDAHIHGEADSVATDRETDRPAGIGSGDARCAIRRLRSLADIGNPRCPGTHIIAVGHGS